MLEDQSEEIENTSSQDEIAESSTVTETEGNELVTEGSAAETPEVKKPNKVQERINQLTREKHEERQKAEEERGKRAELEQRLEALESNSKAQTKQAAPNEDDFDSYSEFETAKTAYIAEVATNAAFERLAQEQNSKSTKEQATARQLELESKKAAFDKNVDSKRGNFEDFDEVALGHTFMDVDLAEQIFEMEKGPEVAYHLGANLDVAERIFSMKAVQRARELTRLEFTLEGLKPKKVSGAPDPITPISGSDQSGSKDPSKMTDAEWLKWRNNQINSRNNHG